MSYMLLIMEPYGQRQEHGRARGEKACQTMMEFAADLQRRGLLEGANSLASTKNAARVQMHSPGKSRLMDGPFAEVKEIIGGYFIVNCATREEAIAIAEQCPAAEWATVEVRRLAPCYED